MGGYYRYQSVTYSTVGSNPNVSSEDYYDHHDYDYVPKRTLVPIATRHGSPTRAYDDEWRHYSPQKADEFLPKRTTIPVTTRPYGDQHKYGSPTKAYPARDDDEWHRQTSPVRDHPNRADEYNKHASPARTEAYPRQNSSVYNYGHPHKYGSPTKAYPARDDDEWHRHTSPVRDRPNRADEYNKHASTRPYGPEYERMSPSTREDQKWHRQQKPQPVISPDWRRSPNGSNKAIMNPGWSSSPRKGTQVSGPTNDIDHFVEMLKQATLEAEEHNRGNKPTSNSYAFPNPRTISSMEAEKKYKGARV